jgi:diguanylate cyclase (GGDEF)-like protein
VPREATSWSTQQLAEFVAGVSSYADEAATVAGAVERAAEALEVETAAFVVGARVVASVGFPRGKVPEEALAAAVEAGAGTCSISLGVLGTATATIASVDEAEQAWLIVAGIGTTSFAADETILLRSMARVLSLHLRTLRAFERERTLRQESDTARALLEQTASIQRLILKRAPVREVLQAITTAAEALLGDEVVSLRMIDPHDPEVTMTVASNGFDPELTPAIARGEIGIGAGGLAMREDRVVVVEDYDRSPEVNPNVASTGLKAAMAAPIHEKGQVIGSLAVATRRPGRSYSEAEQNMLAAFAGHAGLALMDARTVDAMLHQALHDPLTRLPNRSLLLDRLEHALARATRTGVGVAVCFVDLDEFKTVNDSLGHAAGDALLVAVAARMQRCARASDTVARLGGDEFAILLEDLDDVSEAVAFASRLADELREPFAIQGSELFTSASIGIATGNAAGDDVLRNADVAMYRAKASGGGTYEVFEPKMRAALLERLELESELRRAVERDEFVLHFQPIYALADGAVAAVEALVRWEHPTRGLVSPGEFIPLAEETGTIVSIGRRVLRDACREAASWPASGKNEIAVAVNVSARQLQDPTLLDDVAEALASSGLAASRLVLEITESVLAPGSERTMHVLRELKRTGVRLALDDFGTGYSSLRYLHEFPLDMLKIAKPFVDAVGGAGGGATLARAIVDIGRTFGLTVVAEGIEHPEQLLRIRGMDADLGQGFLLSRPVDAATLKTILAGVRDLRVA